MIPQLVAPTSTALAGKIVRFELFHDGVDLYESTEGMVVTKELPSRRLLTTFPIVAQDEKTVTIDATEPPVVVLSTILDHIVAGHDESFALNEQADAA